ncbi:hypothetical protein [Nocardia asiatica]|uniref:hypothetical protein n=1 Tax=Nocardia asiatica TaxID=209252 RepID=UPI003EE42002
MTESSDEIPDQYDSSVPPGPDWKGLAEALSAAGSGLEVTSVALDLMGYTDLAQWARSVSMYLNVIAALLSAFRR